MRNLGGLINYCLESIAKIVFIRALRIHHGRMIRVFGCPMREESEWFFEEQGEK